MAQIDQFLKVLVEQGGSDLHLTVGSPPVMRVHGHLQRIKFRELSQSDMEALVYEIMEEDWRINFIDSMDYDFAYEIEGLARFRANVFWQRKGLGMVMRTIPEKILTADQLGLPEAVRRLCMLTKGLVLVTGPTGSGKSTTLAAMVDLINGSRAKARLIRRLGWCLTMTTTTMGWLMRRIFFQRIHEISLTLTGTELETMQTLTLMTPRSNSLISPRH